VREEEVEEVRRVEEVGKVEECPSMYNLGCRKPDQAPQRCLAVQKRPILNVKCGKRGKISVFVLKMRFFGSQGPDITAT